MVHYLREDIQTTLKCLRDIWLALKHCRRLIFVEINACTFLILFVLIQEIYFELWYFSEILGYFSSGVWVWFNVFVKYDK